MPIKKIKIGVNDLRTQHPNVAAQAHGWDASSLTGGSNKIVEWKCDIGHIFKTSPKLRTGQGQGCPYCSGKRVLKGFNDLQTTLPNVAAEWHPTLNGDLNPSDFTKGSRQKAWWKCSNNYSHVWSSPIKERLKSNCPFCAGRRVLAGSNDLAALSPEISSEWHPSKNQGLSPTEVSNGSDKIIWWRCAKYSDHEWQASIKNRTLRGSKCPICSGAKAKAGFNDLSTLSPALADQWHATKNGNLQPSDVTKGSGKSAWWKCSANPSHEWKAAISSRANSACPICNGNKIVLEGVNDLVTTYPEIARDWHPTLNGDLRPQSFTRGSDKRIWWQCPGYVEHVWQTSIINKRGCPYCSGQKALAGFNDIETTSPKIAKTWHSSKNGTLRPSQLTIGSKKKVWWQCLVDSTHEWQTTPNARNNTGCPFCAGRMLIPGVNDLASADPVMALEWHPTKNGLITPSDVFRHSAAKVWWQCSRYSEHEWKSTIAGRRGCPICSGNKIMVGFNDLKTTHAVIASQWHPTKNAHLSPTEVSKGSVRKVWWICPTNDKHEWEATINSRTSLDAGCPSCAQVGYDPNQDGWLYLMQRPGEQQIGITNNLTRRVKQHEKYGWTLTDHIGPACGRDVQKIESMLKKWLRSSIGVVEGTHENWPTITMEVSSLNDLRARSGISRWIS
jgi:hypothetical protein